jgi:hypothetical protein
MRTLLTIVGGLLGSVAGFQGMLWLTSTFHPGDNNMWPLSALEHSFVFGLPLGTAVFGLLGYAFGSSMDKRRASKSFDPHIPGEASSVDGQSARCAPRPVVLYWTVPGTVGLLLAALVTFPGVVETPSLPVVLTCWCVIPVALFLGYLVWMWSSRPKASRTSPPADSWQVAAKRLLIAAGLLGCLASGIAAPTAIVLWIWAFAN